MEVSSQELEIAKHEVVVTNHTDFSPQLHPQPSQYPRFTRQRSVWNMSDKYSDILTVDYLLHNSQSYQRDQDKYKDSPDPDKRKRQTSDIKQMTRGSSLSTPDFLYKTRQSAQSKFQPDVVTSSDNKMMDISRSSEVQADAPFVPWSYEQFDGVTRAEVTTPQSIEHRRRQQEKMNMIIRQRIRLLKQKSLQRIRKTS